jgi:hypothetical protein
LIRFIKKANSPFWFPSLLRKRGKKAGLRSGLILLCCNRTVAWRIINTGVGVAGTIIMALVMMALLFMMMEKIENQDETPLLTGRDITELLTFYLQKSPTEDALFMRIENRHKQRRQDIKNASLRKLKSFG